LDLERYAFYEYSHRSPGGAVRRKAHRSPGGGDARILHHAGLLVAAVAFLVYTNAWEMDLFGMMMS